MTGAVSNRRYAALMALLWWPMLATFAALFALNPSDAAWVAGLLSGVFGQWLWGWLLGAWPA